jgi:WD40 repeat protein
MSPNPGRLLLAGCWLLLGAFATAVPATQKEPAKVDCFGDPLPPGVVARLGTVRFRHGGYWQDAVVSPDGKTLAVMTNWQTLYLWNAADGKLRKKIEADSPLFRAVAFTADGSEMVSAGQVRLGDDTFGPGTVCFWDSRTGKQRLALQYTDDGYPTDVVVSRDGKTVFTANSDSSIRVWDVKEGKERLRTRCSDAGACALALSPDG